LGYVLRHDCGALAIGGKLITHSLAAKGLYLMHCCDPIACLIGGGIATSPQGRLGLDHNHIILFRRVLRRRHIIMSASFYKSAHWCALLVAVITTTEKSLKARSVL
jgi:hypothetical protein